MENSETTKFLIQTYKPDDKNKYVNLRPRLICADGFSLSVQASATHYCIPRVNEEGGIYVEVEIGYPSVEEENLMPYIDGNANEPTKSVYGYVPIEIVDTIIAKHGGIKKEI